MPSNSPDKDTVQLQAEIERLQRALNSAIAGILVIDLENNIRFVNEPWLNVFGLSAKETLGKPITIFHTQEQLSNDLTPFLAEVKQNREKIAEIRGMTKNKEVVFLWVRGSLLLDPQGKTDGYVITARNITNEKKTVHDLQGAQKELLARTNELEKMNQLMIGREERILELKKEVNDLLREIGRTQRYSV